MSDNLNLWSAVEKTPPSQTKEITGKPYKGTSPKPHYLIWKATETFGPCGIGWGFQIIDERIEEGAGGEKMHIARVLVWYEWNGKRGQVEHVGGTQFSGIRSSNKPFTDEDAPKKSVTDALVKALSMIGFAGDIFMGRYDDSKYLSDLKNEERAESSKPKDAPKPVDFWDRPSLVLTVNGGAEAWAAKFASGCEKAPDQARLTKWWEDNDAHIKALPDAEYKRCQDAMDKRMGFWAQHPTGKAA